MALDGSHASGEAGHVDDHNLIDNTLAGSSGTLASRPSASSVQPGHIYLATNVNGGTLYRSDGSSWTQLSPGISEPGGQELAYAELATTAGPYTTASEVAISGLSTTFTSTGAPVVVKISGLVLSAMTGEINSIIRVWDGPLGTGTELIRATITPRPSTVGIYTPFAFERRITPSAGSKTYNCGINAGAASGAALWLAADVWFPWALTVRKA